MASNGVMTGNSDYSYIPAGWTCQSLLNTATLNLGYDVAAPDEVTEDDHKAKSLPRARGERKIDLKAGEKVSVKADD
jgi:hypothetical protein